MPIRDPIPMPIDSRVVNRPSDEVRDTICLWRCSADRACHLSARRGASSSPIGSRRTIAPSPPSAAWPIFWPHFDLMVNRSYSDIVRHCGTAVLPARPRKRRHKAKIEACVGAMDDRVVCLDLCLQLACES